MGDRSVSSGRVIRQLVILAAVAPVSGEQMVAAGSGSFENASSVRMPRFIAWFSRTLFGVSVRFPMGLGSWDLIVLYSPSRLRCG